MKARIREVELDDATATDIATVLGQIISQRTPQLEQPRAVDEHEAEAVEVIDEPEPAPAFGVTRADRVAPRDVSREERLREHLTAAAYDAAGEEPETPAYPPVPKWQDMLEHGRWGGNKNTLHLKHPDKPGTVRCGEKSLMPEDAMLDYPQAASLGKVCGTCWRRSVEAGRS